MQNKLATDNAIAMPVFMPARELLQRTFQAAEMQVIVASLFGGIVEASRIPAMVTSAVNSDRAVQYVISRAGIDVKKLVAKLNELPPTALFAIQQAISSYRTMGNTEMFGPDMLPSRATLSRLGLVKSPNDAAWGLAVVQLADWRICEFVLRQDPVTLAIEKFPNSLDQAASALLELVRSVLDGRSVPKRREMAFGLTSLIALHTGHRCFRVQERNANFSVVEIRREALLGDIYRGQLGGLALRGVNAPEASSA